MDRRRFLQGLAISAASMSAWGDTQNAHSPEFATTLGPSSGPGDQTLLCSFEHKGESWKVYEDLRVRDGAFTFVRSDGQEKQLRKTAEATFAENGPPYLGIPLKDIGLSGHDLLADRLLEHGDPDPDQVRRAAPPLESAPPERGGYRLPWNTFVGTRECSDTMPVFPSGNTRTYHPNQFFPDLKPGLAQKRFEGLIGGWMPAVRKVMPLSGSAYYELIIFGDVLARDRFIVQTWHRTALIENGKITKVEYGYSYPPFPPRRHAPQPEEFYRGLLIFATYWEDLLRDIAPAHLPDATYSDMTRHAFAKELMVRPGGVYPKYGAVDRDYYGSEYDGFQDIFTSSVFANLEWGRFEMARQVIDNYLTDFTDDSGMINMRGPETAQFGLTLFLLARYYQYTGDAALLLKHRKKIEATASLLLELHDESLRLSSNDPGHGLIHGWSESDSCLFPNPNIWWQPYFSNSAYAARGLAEISSVWNSLNAPGMKALASEWEKRSNTLRRRVAESVEQNIRRDMAPPYIGPLPGTKLTFRESMEQERPSPQGWPHRAYSELLQAEVLPPQLGNAVIDCMRAYGATTLGVVANVSRPRETGRDILGFISYGYARALLALDRIEEYLLFLYSHRYHDHTPGSWVAGEVAGITGDSALFCIPAQLTIPLLVRWMLVFEDADEERLYLGRALPHSWVGSEKEISIEGAPTRWGRVSFSLKTNMAAKTAHASVKLEKQEAREIYLRIRLPERTHLLSAKVNGKPANLAGKQRDTILIQAGNERTFEVEALLA
jgi:hypothetical protein